MLATHRRLAASLAGTATLLGGLALASPAQAATQTSIFNVVLTAADGTLIAGADVTVDLMPADLGATNLVPLQLVSGTTDSAGRFTVKVESNYDLSPYVHDDDTVSLLVNASKGTDSTIFNLRPDVPRSDSTVSKLAETLGSTDALPVVVPVAFGETHAEETGAVATTLSPEASLGAAPNALPPGVNSSHGCGPSYQVVWTLRSDYKDQNVSIVKFMTGANSTFKYDWNTRNETQSGVAYEYNSGNSLVSASAGLEKNVTSYAGTTFHAANSTTKWGALTTRFRKYEKMCQNLFDPAQAFSDTYSWQWRPYEWTGGTAYKSSAGHFTCNTKYKTGTSNPLWVSKDVENVVSGAFSINGLSLSAKQKNTTSTKFTATPDSGKTMVLCGSNALPPSAKQIREL